jgi:hypothetical protein
LLNQNGGTTTWVYDLEKKKPIENEFIETVYSEETVDEPA